MAEFEQTVRDFIKTYEGEIAHMYLDGVGKVTVGVGNMLPDAQAAVALAFVVAAGGERASDQQIIDEFDVVSGQPTGHNANYYAQFCKLRLPERDIDALLDNRIEGFVAGLRQQFAGFDAYPDDARLGLIDMAFNLGLRGVTDKFPTFTAAARRSDWQTCAAQCRRVQVQPARNAAVRQLFLNCATR